MRVFKFLSCKFGLRALRERRLKISEVRSLNDPFDWTTVYANMIPSGMSDAQFRVVLFRAKERFRRIYNKELKRNSPVDH